MCRRPKFVTYGVAGQDHRTSARSLILFDTSRSSYKTQQLNKHMCIVSHSAAQYSKCISKCAEFDLDHWI